jgi:hypothetical protein
VQKTETIVLELHENLVDVTERELESQILRLLPKLRHNIGKQFSTTYERLKLSAFSENDGAILQWTVDDRLNDRVDGFMEVGCYQIV